MAFDVFQMWWTKVQDFNVYMDTIADKRTKDRFLMSSPWPTFCLTLLYLLMVAVGPRVMKNRNPFNLKWIIVIYNMTITLLNLHIALEITITAYNRSYSWKCQPIRNVEHPDEIRMANAVYLYYFSKLLEFADTFFFILRKKDKQLTFLHVYHHSTMFCFWWWGTKFAPSGSTFAASLLNSWIHVIMYTYYTLAALGPQLHKYLWWKKYLTMLQLMQFSILFVLGLRALVWVPCDFILWMQYVLVSYMVSFLVLFGNFYLHAYIKNSRDKKKMEPHLMVKEREMVVKGETITRNITHRSRTTGE